MVPMPMPMPVPMPLAVPPGPTPTPLEASMGAPDAPDGLGAPSTPGPVADAAGGVDDHGAGDADAETQLEQLRRIRDALVGRHARKVDWAMRPGALGACVGLVARPVRSLPAAQVRTQGAALLGLLCQSAASSRVLRGALLGAAVPHALLGALHEAAAELRLAAVPARDPVPDHASPALGVPAGVAIGELARTLQALTRALAALFSQLTPLATAPSRTGTGYGRAYFSLAEAALAPTSAARGRTASPRKPPPPSPSPSARPRPRPRSRSRPRSLPRPPSSAPGRSASDGVSDDDVRAQLRRAIQELYEPCQIELLCSLLFLPDIVPAHLVGGQDRARLADVALNVCNLITATLSVPSLLPPARSSHADGQADGHTDEQEDTDAHESLASDPLSETDERKDALLAFRLADSAFGSFLDALPPTLAPGILPEPPTIMVSSSSLSRAASRRDNEAGVLSQLVALLESGSERVQESAAWALAELVRGKTDACAQLLRCTTPSGALITSLLLSLHTHPNLRLWVAALTCFAYLIRSRSFTSRTSAHVLFLTVGLLDQTDIEVQMLAVRSLGRLVADDGALQGRAANELDAIPRLALVWAQAHAALLEPNQAGAERTPSELQTMAQLGESTLNALAALSYDSDAIRALVIDVSPAVLPTVVSSLKNPATPLGVKVACLTLIRSLARSVTVLRTSLLDAGVAEAVLPHTSPHREGEEDEDVLLALALGVLADLVLSFSPMKPRLVGSEGCVAQVVASTSHAVEEVRVNALWVLKNLLYDTDTRTKESLMSAYGWEQLYAAAQTSGGEQEEALGIVRNLVAPGEEDVALVLSHWGGRVYRLLEGVLQDYAHELASPKGVEQAAWTLANLAAGGQGVRHALLARSNLLDGVVSLLGDPYASLRDAGVVCAINLMHTSSAPFERTMAADAARTLQLFGLDRELRSLVACEEIVDVQARARSALALLEQLAPPSATAPANQDTTYS